MGNANSLDDSLHCAPLFPPGKGSVSMVANIIKRVACLIQVALFPTIQDRELQRWRQDCGDSEKRFTYPLTAESIVIDLGGYDGQWASDLFSRYLPEIYVFEAIPDFAEKIYRRFASNSKIKIYSCAVGNNARTAQIYLHGTGSSLFKVANKSTTVRVEDAAKLFNLCTISHCDLLKINIEGSEYEVIPRLIESGLISKIDNLQIQFHNLESGSLAKMNAIQAELSKTHVLTWQYTWVWENWRRKDG